MIDATELRATIEARARELAKESGEEFTELAGSALDHFTWLAGEVADLASGDPRTVAHFEAQLAHLDFQTKATAYLQLVAWKHAALEVLGAVADDLVTIGKALAAEALKGFIASLVDQG